MSNAATPSTISMIWLGHAEAHLPHPSQSRVNIDSSTAYGGLALTRGS
ncbi:hypothetical protein D046_1927 [Vibrio parahaemolyticus V-223/04]|nr:hypothetical protein D046_1927 [Vibrio parahaemolyticus V-223/04]